MPNCRLGDAVHRILKRHRLGLSGDLLDGGVDQRWARCQVIGQRACLVHQLRAGMDAVDQTPAGGLLGIDPTTGQQHFHRDMVGDPLGQFDRRRVGHRAGAYFRQGKTRVIRRQDDVGAQRQFQPATASKSRSPPR